MDSGLFSGFGSGLDALGVSRPTGIGAGDGRSIGGPGGRGAGRLMRGGPGTVGGVDTGVVVGVVGAGCVAPGLDETPGRPAGGSGVERDVVVGGVPADGGVSGTGVEAAGTGVCFDP